MSIGSSPTHWMSPACSAGSRQSTATQATRARWRRSQSAAGMCGAASMALVLHLFLRRARESDEPHQDEIAEGHEPARVRNEDPA
jgi:hypothetical protein